MPNEYLDFSYSTGSQRSPWITMSHIRIWILLKWTLLEPINLVNDFDSSCCILHLDDEASSTKGPLIGLFEPQGSTPRNPIGLDKSIS